MKGQGPAAALTAAAVLACWCGAAEAYRPFDGTDAAVAGEMEIELGPIEYFREGSERALFAPDVRFNYGFTPGWEAVLEGRVAHGLTADIAGTSLLGSGASLKGVLREGSLQEKAGPSDRHREIRYRPLRRQRSCRPRGKVDHLDVAGIRHIDKDLGPGFVDLETLGMALETNIGGFGPRCRIDNRQRALAVAHQHAIARRVHPHIVGVIAELDARDRRKISPRSTRTEPSPAFATKTLSANGT
jgi:hypothetical protein